ncbi:DJ-1/PfpI family protein [Nonomuraea turkmeniaca]|uniref:DJ-1/PfpI family protein n=1 Tax=Nonomuraea turkmeniaca TaxID=103838 RepID=UPI001B8779FB|nr:DJ-1/PfpI family protein [Nonomuraea turkmeniaca]
MAAPTTRAVKLLVHDFEPGWDAYTERPGRQLPVDLAFADVRPEDYQALVIRDGRAPEYIRADPDVSRIVHYFFERGLPVGTICHGPQVPAALGVLRGRTTAAFPPLRTDMEMAGATFVDAPDVVDGAMVAVVAGQTCLNGRVPSCACWKARTCRCRWFGRALTLRHQITVLERRLGSDIRVRYAPEDHRILLQ